MSYAEIPAPGVYPRVCGGSVKGHAAVGALVGLSPRVRGKRLDHFGGGGFGRSIPACAGEAYANLHARRGRAVYPRVCGGSVKSGVLTNRLHGLSPRVRGKLGAAVSWQPGIGSIPACAGEAPRAPPSTWLNTVYPRVCGGSHSIAFGKFLLKGLSPRVRGKHRQWRRPINRPRSIPACAGEAGNAVSGTAPSPVYPRVCGGSAGEVGAHIEAGGLSPRVRGKPAPAPARARK